MKVSREKFVEIWQTSTSVNEVCERAGIEESMHASRRASHWRKKGIPLKIMGPTGGGKVLDVDRLAALAKRYAPE